MTGPQWHDSSLSYAIKKEFIRYFQKQPPEVFCKRDALKDFANFKEKHLLKTLLNKKLQHCEIFKSTCSEEHLRTTASVYLKSKLQIMQFTHKPKTFNFRIYKVFSYLFSFANFSSTKFIFAFASFLLTKHFHCFVLHKNLNRLNGLSPYQKFVPMDNAWVQALFSKAV